LLGWFIVTAIIVAAAHIKLFISVISNVLLLLFYFFEELIIVLCSSDTDSKFYIVAISVNCWFAYCIETSMIHRHIPI
jgi:hypothetical protein